VPESHPECARLSQGRQLAISLNAMFYDEAGVSHLNHPGADFHQLAVEDWRLELARNLGQDQPHLGKVSPLELEDHITHVVYARCFQIGKENSVVNVSHGVNVAETNADGHHVAKPFHPNTSSQTLLGRHELNCD
jgi:hypothetical protein